jgi:hypothetical protein
MIDQPSTFACPGSSINEISGCYPKGSFGATFVLPKGAILVVKLSEKLNGMMEIRSRRSYRRRRY